MNKPVNMKEKVPITFELYELEMHSGLETVTLVSTVVDKVAGDEVWKLANVGALTEFMVGRAEYVFIGVGTRDDEDMNSTEDLVVRLLKKEQGRAYRFYLDNNTHEGETGYTGEV